MNHRALMFFIVVLLTGCASQKSPNAPAPDFGCRVSTQNAEQMCLMFANDFRLDPSHYTLANISNANQPHATTRTDWGVKTPRGEFAAQVTCEINTAHYSIVYAKLLEGPKTQEQADYLQSQGLCSD